MLDMIFLIGVGVVIGWHVPMPPWAKWAINLVKNKVQGWMSKS